MAFVSLFVASVILVNVGIEAYNNGHQPNDNIEWNCGGGGSCHDIPGEQSASTVTLAASTLTPSPGGTVFLNVTVVGAEAANTPLGIMIVRNLTLTNSQPSVDGWVIVDNPAGTGAFNYFENVSYSLSGTWMWTLQAPLAGGTYNLYAREMHGNGDQYWRDSLPITFTIVGVDNPPSLYITAPGSAPGEQYVQGTMLGIDWAASDDNPWPAGGLVVNLTFGAIPTGGMPLANDLDVTLGTYIWDTSVIAPGIYYINGSVWDSSSQLGFNNCNNSFEIIAPDNAPTFFVTGPGSTPGEQYVQGSMLPITWAASDDNPWPAGGLVVNLTFGAIPTGGMPLANDLDVASGTYNWDTSVIAPGIYYINGSVWDSSSQNAFNNCNNSFEIVIIDLSPTLYVTNPGSTPGEVYGQGSLIMISWAAWDESPWPFAGNIVNLSYGPTPTGGTPIANDQDVTVGFSWDTTPVPMGFYYINASVYDSSGNVTLASCNNSFEITAPDINPPIILNALAMPSPQELGLPTNVSATITDDTTLDAATVFINVTYPSAATTNISMARSVDLFWVDQPFMEIGLYSFIIWAADTSANWASDVGAFEVVDTTPPAIAGTTALPSPQVSGGLVNISAQITDLDSIATADVEVFDPLGAPLFNVSMLIDPGTGRYYWETTYVPLGIYTFDIWASDPSGNWVTDTGNFEILGDITPPVINNVNAIPPVQVSGGNVNVSANVTDDTALFGVWIELFDPAMVSFINTTMSYDALNALYYYDSSYIAIGQWTFVISANDTSDNWASAQGNFDITDGTPPVITHIPVTSANLGVAIPIIADVTDAGTIAAVTLYYMNVGDVVYTNVAMVLGVGTEYSASIPAQTQIGNVKYYIDASDSSSNTARKPAAGDYTILIIDSVPPTITNPAADPPTIEAGDDTTISADVSDDSGVSEVRVFIDGPDDSGGSYVATFNTVTGLYESTVTPTVPGSYTYAIWALDGSGNWGSETGSFNVTAPAGKTPNPPEGVQTLSVNGNSILVSWVGPDQYNDSSPLDADDIKGYFVYRSETPTGTYQILTNQAVRGELYLDGDVQVGDTYYYKIATVMMDDSASELSTFALGELEEIKDQASVDMLPWIVAIVFLVLWIITLIAFMLGKKAEKGPSEPSGAEMTPITEQPAVDQPVAEEPYTEAPEEQAPRERYDEVEEDEELLDEMDG